jgi:hypothetical protein
VVTDRVFLRCNWSHSTEARSERSGCPQRPESTYTHGVADPSLVSADGYTLDNHYLARPGAGEIQLDLFLSYASNIDLSEAFKRDIPGADVRLLDTGHFAVETHAAQIATAIRGFLTG